MVKILRCGWPFPGHSNFVGDVIRQYGVVGMWRIKNYSNCTITVPITDVLVVIKKINFRRKSLKIIQLIYNYSTEPIRLLINWTTGQNQLNSHTIAQVQCKYWSNALILVLTSHALASVSWIIREINHTRNTFGRFSTKRKYTYM